MAVAAGAGRTGPPTTSAPGRVRARPTQARVTRNTELMITAAVDVLATTGWAGLSLAAVARRMRRSDRPVRDRAGDRVGLAALVWQERLGPALVGDLRRCVAAVDAVALGVAGSTAPATSVARSTASADTGAAPVTGHDASVAEFVAALGALLRRSPERDATAELLVISRFDPAVGEAVDADLGTVVREWTTPDTAGSPTTAARRGYVLALALGLLLSARQPRAASADLGASLPAWATALRSPAEHRSLPRRSAVHMDITPQLAADDPALDALLNAALTLVGRHGYDGVTVAGICRAAGHTEGLAFSRYRSKLDLVIDATRRQNEAGFRLNHDFTAGLHRDFGTGVAEAVTIRESLLPDRDLGRSTALELTRLGWHQPGLFAAQVAELDAFRATLLEQPGWAEYESESDFLVLVAFSLGSYALPRLAPNCHSLPWDVVTVPLYDLFERRRGELAGT